VASGVGVGYRGSQSGSSAAPVLQVLRMPSQRGRTGEKAAYDEVRRHHAGPRKGYAVPIAPRDIKSDLDSGGNILCAPPVSSFPFGRIVFGHAEARPMSDDLRSLLFGQDVQLCSLARTLPARAWSARLPYSPRGPHRYGAIAVIAANARSHHSVVWPTGAT
jgi:hypothetical protein